MAENQVTESSEETETDDEWSDPARQRESTGKGTVSEKRRRKKHKTVCEDSQGSPFWKGLLFGLCLVARIVVESALGPPFMTVCAIGPDVRNRCRDRILRESAECAGTTGDHPDGRTRKRKKKEHGEKKESEEEKESEEKKICNIM